METGSVKQIVRDVKLWVMSISFSVLLGIVGYGAVHLINVLEDGIATVAADVKETNEIVIGHVAQQLEINRTHAQTHEDIQARLKTLTDKVTALEIEQVRITGRAIKDINPRGGSMRPLDIIKQQAREALQHE